MDATAKNNEELTNIKHLDYLQAIITRHNNNSFMLKGWTITLLSALLALSGAIKEPCISIIALLPIIIFWSLDALYLSNERCFIDLFNSAVKGKYIVPKKKANKKNFKITDENSEIGEIKEFDMNFIKFKKWEENSWLNVLTSKTILCFYLPLTIFTLITFGFQINSNLLKKKPIEINANIKPNSFEIKFNNQVTSYKDSLKK
jgi:hypothetical protein